MCIGALCIGAVGVGAVVVSCRTLKVKMHTVTKYIVVILFGITQ